MLRRDLNPDRWVEKSSVSPLGHLATRLEKVEIILYKSIVQKQPVAKFETLQRINDVLRRESNPDRWIEKSSVSPLGHLASHLNKVENILYKSIVFQNLTFFLPHNIF